MNWSYSGDPSQSAKDAVRFLIGDTDPEDKLLLDGEINYLLNQTAQGVFAAAIRGCEQIMAKFSRLADEKVGQVDIKYSQKAMAYAKMKSALIQRMATEDCLPYAGGISVSDKETNIANTDRVKPDFQKHMMENRVIAPWTSQSVVEDRRDGTD